MHIKGKIKISSISKIRNTRAITKNREEKITLEVSNGKKPHSKGDINIWLKDSFLETKAPAKSKIIERIIDKEIIEINLKITKKIKIKI